MVVIAYSHYTEPEPGLGPRSTRNGTGTTGNNGSWYLSPSRTSVNIYRPQRSWGKVIFSQVSVILSTGAGGRGMPGLGGGSAPWRRGICSWEGGSAPGGGCLVETPWDGYCCGRYAYYWNAFLFYIISESTDLGLMQCEHTIRYTTLCQWEVWSTFT